MFVEKLLIDAEKILRTGELWLAALSRYMSFNTSEFGPVRLHIGEPVQKNQIKLEILLPNGGRGDKTNPHSCQIFRAIGRANLNGYIKSYCQAMEHVQWKE
jgi:hypothetical protein